MFFCGAGLSFRRRLGQDSCWLSLCVPRYFEPSAADRHPPVAHAAVTFTGPGAAFAGRLAAGTRTPDALVAVGAVAVAGRPGGGRDLLLLAAGGDLRSEQDRRDASARRRLRRGRQFPEQPAHGREPRHGAHRQGVAQFPPCARCPRGHAFLSAPRRRSPRHRAGDPAQPHAPPRRRGGQHAHPAARPQQLAPGRQDVGPQAPGGVRGPAHRASLYEAADSRILRQPHLLRRQHLRHRDGQPGVFRQTEQPVGPLRVRHDGRTHPQPQPFLAPGQPHRRGPRTRHRARAHGRAAHDHRRRGTGGGTRADQGRPEPPQRRAGQLRHGVRAQRAEPACSPTSRPTRAA